MTDDEMTIAAGFVCVHAWEWLPGALSLPDPVGGDALPACRYLGRGLWVDGDGARVEMPHGALPLPDLRDPSTMGCVEALMHRQWAGVEAARGPMTPHEALQGDCWLVTPIRGQGHVRQFFFRAPTKAGVILKAFAAGAERATKAGEG